MSDAGRLLSWLAARAARRPLLTLALLGALGAGAAALALRLHATAASGTLVGRSSSTYEATQRFYERFGEEPVEVLVEGDLRKLLFSADIQRLAGLEGCLSGKLPSAAFASAGGASGPCAQLERANAVKVVLGPGTFINEAALQIDRSLGARRAQAEREAGRARTAVRRAALSRGLSEAQASKLGGEAASATMAGFAAEVSALAIRYGLSATPSIADRGFVSALVFDSSKPAGTPKQRFAYLFPGREAALVSVRLEAHLSDAQRTHAIALIRSALAMPQWRLANGESYLLTGEPVIADELESSISRSIELLLIAVIAAMALILSLVFKSRPRLLPLAVALLAPALAFGALSASGASLTMASVAVLPVLVGLSVDYAIQIQSRAGEAPEHGGALERGGAPERGQAAVSAPREAAGHGATSVGLAALASMGGLAALELSPVPMVRGFGLLLVVGVALAFLCALLACSAALALARGRTPRAAWGRKSGAVWGRAYRLLGGLRAAWQGARELLADNHVTRGVQSFGLGYALERPGRVLAIGLALAALGWAADTQTSVQTDVSKLAPQSMSSLSSLRALERSSGVGGELDLMVSSASLTRPSTIAWMVSYESELLHRFGYTASSGCARAELCPAFSLPDLFQAAAGAGAASGAGGAGQGTVPGAVAGAAEGAVAGAGRLTQAQVNGLLAAVPGYLRQYVMTSDRRSAALSFGIRLMPLERQQRLIEQMRASLHPPAGVHAQLVGLSVMAAESGAQIVSTWRRMEMLLVALGAVALVLLALFKGELRRALVPLVPVVLATGWSALLLFATRVPLNPMSVTMGALVIAISTEFSVLLSERQRQEALSGHGTVEALRRAYRYTGAAVAASGVTAIAGFAVLALSDIAMLRDFGLVTLVDLSVSLLGVLVALPAAVALAERRERRWARATGATSPSLG